MSQEIRVVLSPQLGGSTSLQSMIELSADSIQSPKPIIPNCSSPTQSHSLRSNLSEKPLKPNQSSPLSPKSQIPLQNKFAPLLKPKPMSSNSSSSGPLYPPGFEDNVPLKVRLAQEKKRHRKKAKKTTSKKSEHDLKPPEHQSPLSPSAKPSSIPISITAEDTVKLALELGLNFDGPISELHSRAFSILKRQKSDWLGNQANIP